MTTLFISDLHLSRQRSDKINLFKKLLKGSATNVDALYILGDLFDDFWVGCDDSRPPKPEIITLLNDYASQPDTRLYIMRGNRDFHVNREFAEATACQLIDDPHEIVLNDKKVLLMHGDTLCTDDVKYQRWRKFITNSLVKWLYSIMPLGLRKKIAGNVRDYVTEASKKKSPAIMDVSQHTVIKTMNEFGVDTIIHGHTHRQAMHDINLNGKTARRIVLGDWYEKDCVLVYENNAFRFERVEDYVNSN